MTLDYSNTSSSSNDDFENDTTFNTNSTDSEYSSDGNEIIPPSPKWRKKNATNKSQTLSRMHATTIPTMWIMEHMRHCIPLLLKTFHLVQLHEWKLQKPQLDSFIMIMIMYKFQPLPQFVNIF